MKIYQRIFRESIQSEKDIKTFAEWVMDRLVDKMLEILDKTSPKNLPNEKDRMWILYELEKVTKGYSPKRDFKKFIDSLKAREFRFYLLQQSGEKGGGFYNSNNDKIILYYNHVVEWNDNVTQGFLSDDSTFTKVFSKIVKEDFYKKYLDTLVHELTHAYDDFISQGKYSPKDYVGFSDDDSISDEYYQQNLEVNAYYTSAINSIERLRINSFESYFSSFKDAFYGRWKVLDKKQQNRLMDRVYKRWSEPIKVNKKEYLNSKSFMVFAMAMKGDDYTETINDTRTGISGKEVIKYAQETIKILLSGRIDPKLFNNYSSYKNRFSFFRMIAGEILDSVGKAKIDYSNLSGNPEIEAIYKRYEIKKKYDKKRLQYFFKLSDDDFMYILERIVSLLD
jgi:hypothetical protein